MVLELVAKAEAIALEKRVQLLSVADHDITFDIHERRHREAAVRRSWRRKLMMGLPRSGLEVMVQSRRRCLAATWSAWREFVLWRTQVRQVYEAHYDIEKAERDLTASRSASTELARQTPSHLAPAEEAGSVSIPATAMRRLQQMRRLQAQDHGFISTSTGSLM